MKKQKRNKRNSVSVREALKNSLTPGLAYIVDHNLHWIERFFWTISFSGCVALAVVLLAPLYERLLNSASVLSVEKDYFNWNVSYPSITLCPDIKINVTALQILSTNVFTSTGINATPYLETIATLNMDSIGQFEFKGVPAFKIIHPRTYAQIAASLFPEFDSSSLSTNTDRSMSIKPVMTELGMCHTINSNVASFDEPRKWRDDATVKYVKRNIQLSVHDAEFFTQIINFDTKYKIFFHYPDELIHSSMRPFSSREKGFLTFSLQLTSTKIADNLRVYGIPVRGCRFTSEPISDRYPIYSYNHCVIECRIKAIIGFCGCVPHLYRPLATERVCSIPELVCLAHYIKAFKLSRPSTSKTANCGCHSDCEYDTYWAEEYFVPRDTNTISVGLSAFPKVRYVRNVIFGPADIFLRAGGVINLCVGASIISIMELLLILLKYLTSVLYKLLK